jgi:hypothetical protein
MMLYAMPLSSIGKLQLASLSLKSDRHRGGKIPLNFDKVHRRWFVPSDAIDERMLTTIYEFIFWKSMVFWSKFSFSMAKKQYPPNLRSAARSHGSSSAWSTFTCTRFTWAKPSCAESEVYSLTVHCRSPGAGLMKQPSALLLAFLVSCIGLAHVLSRNHPVLLEQVPCA